MPEYNVLNSNFERMVLRMTKIAVLGYGTVGSGVVEVLTKNQKIINNKAKEEIDIKYVLDLRDFPGDPIQDKIVHDFDVILKDPEVRVVVEVMGGLHPAYEFTKAALEEGKSVCTSNKELVAEFGPELISIAHANNVNYLFEASCGGGIPIIRPLNSSITADDVDEITGILNGTTNYILTEMTEKGLSYEEVLKDAQAKGYAERNPEADVEGYDAVRKLAILSSLAYGRTADYKKIYTEGITKISKEDIDYAKAMGREIKLLATSRKTVTDGEKHCYALVAPFLIDASTPLYSVNGVYNAILVHGNMLGYAMFYGAGAGSLPTASAVVSDVVDEVRHIGRTLIFNWNPKQIDLPSVENDEKKFFVRVSADKLEKAKSLMNAEEVVSLEGHADEAGLVTEKMSEKEFNDRAEKLGGVISRIRIKEMVL